MVSQSKKLGHNVSEKKKKKLFTIYRRHDINETYETRDDNNERLNVYAVAESRRGGGRRDDQYSK